MITLPLLNILLALAGAATTWVGAIMVNRSFGTGRAILVIGEVSRDAHGVREVEIRNVGARAATSIRLCIDGECLSYVDGLAAGESRTMKLTGGDDAVTFRLEFVDASRSRRRLDRCLEGGEMPMLSPALPPGRRTRIAQWLRLAEMQ